MTCSSLQLGRDNPIDLSNGHLRLFGFLPLRSVGDSVATGRKQSSSEMAQLRTDYDAIGARDCYDRSSFHRTGDRAIYRTFGIAQCSNFVHTVPGGHGLNIPVAERLWSF